MTRKAVLAASLLLPLMVASGAAYAGPKDLNYALRPATQAGGSEAMNAFAQAGPMKHDGGWQCRYQGGPKAPLVHFR